MLLRVAPGLKFRDPRTKTLHDEHDAEPIIAGDGDFAFAKFVEQGDLVRVDGDAQPKAE